MPRLRFDYWAEQWSQAGKSDEVLVLDDWKLLILHLWVLSKGAQREGVRADVAELDRQSWRSKEAQPPGWYDYFLRECDECAGCGETYRLENLSVCTRCLSCRCHACDSGKVAPIGNRGHEGCDGEYVG